MNIACDFSLLKSHDSTWDMERVHGDSTCRGQLRSVSDKLASECGHRVVVSNKRVTQCIFFHQIVLHAVFWLQTSSSYSGIKHVVAEVVAVKTVLFLLYGTAGNW